MMGGMATRSLKLENGKGVKFYSFQDIPDASEFIETWYTEMNALDLSQEVKQAIVDEGNVVFALNIELFSELDGNPFQSVFALAWDALKEKLGSSEKSLAGVDK
jgi:heme oxygenase